MIYLMRKLLSYGMPNKKEKLIQNVGLLKISAKFPWFRTNCLKNYNVQCKPLNLGSSSMCICVWVWHFPPPFWLRSSSFLHNVVPNQFSVSYILNSSPSFQYVWIILYDYVAINEWLNFEIYQHFTLKDCERV